ncbi:pyridoxamine 5'-phosphate oxidase family protein [Methermicoccus shengliensis]|uniref:Pyridoxamine 5'-phosphate oxidase family protein n=1 Tax=Methermicoccus shengliensis TaxID=660064 RepID=A0A832VWY0_9EURY|nr:pyridoxamine 5'-phosphate oxidase family protein [Methermicoccus shengliensis]KUK05041.1 MAG: Pyridoxamine 5'-phosphate oxidase-related, FMN-binding protein [Euryarchaeota archaeon 55_53]KUK30251.1 MAG: Pyridoxamine 5'-phosphate oxidase-related, FMN-binding protein [Methanosarcinales archeaon 56_1174]MDI3487575.1 hypothetical protein [Methanosarcinales archaeon]MDN5294724.1 hypothetical protein [Methanosarcinales archaeon]HIH69437.1 pyridoxamine 5'-phosphate oxidase family protein [Methermi
MEFKDCIEFANRVKTSYLATVDGDQPRVRALEMWFADQTGFYFQTQTVKALYRQLKKNPKVEVCFWDPQEGKMLRVSGTVEFLDDLELKRRCLEERSFLKQMGIKGPDDPLLAVFRIAKGEAFFWTMEWSMKEDQIPRITFG